MKWLHISDIHFNYKNYETNNLKKKLIKKLKSLSLDLDFILITGDCFYKYEGFNAEQTQMINFIKELAKACNCDCENVFFSQGNHDVNRNDKERNKLIENVRSGKVDFTNTYEKLCELGNEKFQRICRDVTGTDYQSYNVFHNDSKQYRIVSINSALLSKDDKDSGKLQLCNNKLSDIGDEILDDDKINILIMHHGIEYVKPEDALNFEHWVEDNNVDVVFCGHSHRSSLDIYKDTDREIKQFTAGGIIIDGYAIPSFHICSYNDIECAMETNLYTYASARNDWVLDNSRLRKFNEGTHRCIFPRVFNKSARNLCLEATTIIDEFNTKYFTRYNSQNIYSNKYDGEEVFDSWKIINSLVNIGMPYDRALLVTSDVINEITKKDFHISNKLLSCFELRDVVYQTIVGCQVKGVENEFELSCWASRYARKYNRNKEILVLNAKGDISKLNYTYIKNTLIKQIVKKVTKSTNYYEKITGNELCEMAESILSFLKNMEIFEIRYNVLESLVTEYMTQKPHPWIVHENRDNLIHYHKIQAEKHIFEIVENNCNCSTQIEALYHICSTFMSKYGEIIGCTELSPITALTNSVNWLHDIKKYKENKLPMLKHKIVQLKKDLDNQTIDFEEFKGALNNLYNIIVEKREINSDEGREEILKLWDYLLKLDNKPNTKKISNESPVEKIRTIFDNAEGFIAKSPLRDLPNCFWTEPNWDLYENTTIGRGKQMLVCVLNQIEDIENIHNYLYKNNNKKFKEIVFLFNTFRSFTSEERSMARKYFINDKYVKCIFIQNEYFTKLSENVDWREIFHMVYKSSR